jgi:serine protease AprX
MKTTWVILAVLTSLCATTVFAAQEAPKSAESLVEKARHAAKEGNIAYQLTTPEALKALLGPPQSEEKKQDEGTETLVLQYHDLTARFSRSRAYTTPFTLQKLTTKPDWLDSLVGRKEGRAIDIGQDRQIVLRSVADLAKCDPLWGVASVSLVDLDLREHKTTLEKMPFDSRTLWPPRDKLPEGFDPVRRLEEGKYPGLGICGLHAQGIDGHGVGIAIIDQPLLKEHQEYARQLVRYEAIDVEGIDVQMHSAPVCSIAVGTKCGVAPQAALYFYAVPPWNWQDNKPWAEQIDKIIELNKTLTDRPKIRVVSISSGMFSQWPNFDLWKAAVDKAAQNGILVATCGNTFPSLAPLRRDPNGDPDDPACYRTRWFPNPTTALGVPAGNHTTASHQGPDQYTYWVEGAMSWAVPYMAGLAALAFQVDPEIPPAQIMELWTTTATQTAAGPIVNPPKFIEAVQSQAQKAR